LGLAIIGIAAMLGLASKLIQTRSSVDEAVRGGFIVTGAATLLVGSVVGSVAYIAATGATVGASHGSHARGDASNTDPHAEHNHDHGAHPTLAQFQALPDRELASMSPPGTITASDVGELRSELAALSSFVSGIRTVENARGAGYDEASADVVGMGAHYLNMGYLTDGVFDPSRPEGLLFSDIGNGERELVGVWFLQLPGSDGATETEPPPGFSSDLDLWHGHNGICYVGMVSVSEDVSQAACEARDGLYIGDQRWMMHVWVAPGVANPNGVFAYINDSLAGRQVSALPLGQGVIP
jgi:hypothetical protein